MPQRGKDGRLELRLEHWVLKGIDEFRRDLPDIPNRSEAARQLIVYGLNAILEQRPEENLDDIRKRLAQFIELELRQRREGGLLERYEKRRSQAASASEQNPSADAVYEHVG